MALRLDYIGAKKYMSMDSAQEIYEREIIIKDAYGKITCVSGDKTGIEITLTLSGKEEQVIRRYAFVPSVADNSENFIKQGYEYLKTLPEFANAVDC